MNIIKVKKHANKDIINMGKENTSPSPTNGKNVNVHSQTFTEAALRN